MADLPQQQPYISPTVTDLEEVIEIAHGVEQFLDSKPGQYLRQRCEDVMEEAMLHLKDHPVYDPEGLRTLQNEIFRAESILDWLKEAIIAGNNAAEELDRPEE